MYTYNFGDMNHGKLHIHLNGEDVGDIYLWECEDIPLEDFKGLILQCKHCTRRFIREHANVQVSDRTLRQIGLIKESENEVNGEFSVCQ